MSPPADTIVAAATPPGRGGIGIVRLSGPAVPEIAGAIVGGLPPPRRATVAAFAGADGRAIDAGLALYFPAPDSYTGEHVLELHGHGGPVVMDLLVARALELGARQARPGEFSERAFLNDKIDLAQAEAVADLIDAGSAEAARAALRSLAGEFSAEVRVLSGQLTGLRVYVEAAIDFPDEDVEFLGSPEVERRLTAIHAAFERVIRAAGQGRALRDGLRVVIAGRPNAGKSSLLNALAGHDAAIVTEIPGTTRDVLRERIDVDGLPIHVIDTAGLRETGDIVEGEGVRRARAEIAQADLVLYLIDATGPFDPAELDTLPAGPPVTLVWNKVDIARGARSEGELRQPTLWISALTGEGLDTVRAHLKAAAGYRSGEGLYSARRRHLEALAKARSYVELAQARLAEQTAFELVAEDLRLAQRALGEITGEVTSDDLLGQIFSSFCIGK